MRSAYGYDNPWFQHALRAGEGRIRVGGVECDVAFEQPGSEIAEGVSRAYHTKYDRYNPGIVGTVVSPELATDTLLTRRTAWNVSRAHPRHLSHNRATSERSIRVKPIDRHRSAVR